MSQMDRVSMNAMPSQGNASRMRVGNGQLAGRFSQGAQAAQCQFPAPPPKRVYCHPAAFTSVNGSRYQRMLDAYGQSRPATGYY